MLRQVSSNDFPQVETLCKSITKEKQPFVRLEMKKEDLLEMFKVKPIVVRFYVIHLMYAVQQVQVAYSQ